MDKKISKQLKSFLIQSNSSNVLPLPLPPPKGPQTGKMGYFCFLIQQINDIRIPTNIENDYEKHKLQCHVDISFFDSCTKSFFGNTWSSPMQSVLVKGTNFFSCQNIPVYFRSSITDDRVFCVIEIVLSVNNICVKKYSLGWSIADTFSRSNVTDITNVNTRIYDTDPELKLDPKMYEKEKKEIEKAKQRDRVLTVFAGTSRSLLVIEKFENEWRNKLKLADKSKILSHLYYVSRLEAVAHLFRENELIGCRDILIGLNTTLPEDLNRPAALGHLSDIPLFTITIEKPFIMLPPSFESKLINVISKSRENTWGCETKKGRISSRRLRIGLHNGRTFLRPPSVVSLSFRSQDGGNMIQLNENPNESTYLDSNLNLEIKALGFFINNPTLAIVVEVEYVVDFSANSTSTSAKSDVIDQCTVAAGHIVQFLYAPNMYSNENKTLKLDGSETNLELWRGPGRTLSQLLLLGSFEPSASMVTSDLGYRERHQPPIATMVLKVETSKNNIVFSKEEFKNVAPASVVVDTENNSAALNAKTPKHHQEIEDIKKEPINYLDGNTPYVTNDPAVTRNAFVPQSQAQSGGNYDNAALSGILMQLQQQQMLAMQREKEFEMERKEYQRNLEFKQKEYELKLEMYAKQNTDMAHKQNSAFDLYNPMSPIAQMLANIPSLDQSQRSAKKLDYPETPNRNVELKKESREEEATTAEIISSNTQDQELGKFVLLEKQLREMERGIDLKLEVRDRLKSSAVLFKISTFFQRAHSPLSTNMIRSIIVGFRFFNCAPYISKRLLLTMPANFEEKEKADINKMSSAQEFELALAGASSKSKVAEIDNYIAHSLNEETLCYVPWNFHSAFMEYLYEKDLVVSFWNGDSLLPIGSSRIRLISSMRQGEPSITLTTEALVVDTQREMSLKEFAKNNASSEALYNSNVSNPANGKLMEDIVLNPAKVVFTIVNTGLAVPQLDEAGIPVAKSSSVGESKHIFDSQLPNLIKVGVAHTLPSHSYSVETNPASGTHKVIAKSMEDTDPEIRLKFGNNSDLSISKKVGASFDESVSSLTEQVTNLSLTAVNLNSIQDVRVREKEKLKRMGLIKTPLFVQSPNENDNFYHPITSFANLVTSKPDEEPKTTQAIALQQAEEALKYSSVNRVKEDIAKEKLKLEMIKSKRQQKKYELISKLVSGSILRHIVLQPSFGTCQYFEVQFTNPMPHVQLFSIAIFDPIFNKVKSFDDEGKEIKDDTDIIIKGPEECTTVFSFEEWGFMKKHNGLLTPINPNLFVSPTDIQLQANETVYIPFKFQSFNAGPISGFAIVPPHSSASAINLPNTASTLWVDPKYTWPALSSTSRQSNPTSSLSFPMTPGSSFSPNYPQIASRTISISLHTTARKLDGGSRETINKRPPPQMMIKCEIRPQPFAVNETFHYPAYNNEMVVQTLRVPLARKASYRALQEAKLEFLKEINEPFAENANDEEKSKEHEVVDLKNGLPTGCDYLKVRSSYENVAFEWDDTRSNTTSNSAIVRTVDSKHGHKEMSNYVYHKDLTFRVSCEDFPEVTHFYLCFYTDLYSCHLHSVWEILIYPYPRSDLLLSVGQLTTGSLLMPPIEQTRSVTTYSLIPASCTPNLSNLNSASLPYFNVAENKSFEVISNSFMQLPFSTRIPQLGIHRLLVQLVDTYSSEMIAGWLINVNASYPQISKSLDISIKCGEQSRRKLKYTNQYNSRKSFYFSTSSPNVKITPIQMILESNDSSEFFLTFETMNMPATEMVILFVNDDKGNLEEAIKLSISRGFVALN